MTNINICLDNITNNNLTVPKTKMRPGLFKNSNVEIICF